MKKKSALEKDVGIDQLQSPFGKTKQKKNWACSNTEWNMGKSGNGNS